MTRIQQTIDFLARICQSGAALEAARLAAALRAGTAAVGRWLTSRWPAPAAGADAYLREALSLKAAGRFAEADAVLSHASASFPDDFETAFQYAALAEDKTDTDEKLRRWRWLHARFPEHPLAHARLGGAVRRSGDRAEAQSVLNAAIARFPDSSEVAMEWAMLALEAMDSAEALQRWQAVVARFPDNPFGHAGVAIALRQLLRLDEADAVLIGAMERFPSAAFLASEYAVNGDMRGDNDAAFRRWNTVRERFPEDAIGYAGLGAALGKANRFAEADALLAVAVERFPQDVNVASNYAWVAVSRSDWHEAIRRCEAANARFPEHPAVKESWRHTLWHAKLAAADEQAAVREGTSHSAPHIARSGIPSLSENLVAVGPGGDDGLLAQDLLMKFESLGENCELGFVQRHYGAEPLGLLRWAGIPLPKLIRGLEDGFAGVGTPANTAMYVDPNIQEYRIADKTYDLSMHTFIAEDKENEGVIFEKICRRARYLRQKLLDDLALGEKIFVFQSDNGLSDQAAGRLHAALRRYGNNALLVVRGESATRLPGEVESLVDNLFVGYLDRLGYDGKQWDISFDLWFTICRKAHLLWMSSSDLAANPCEREIHSQAC
jgi:tetratricopeptide (TPR) repeat protein